MPKIKNPEKRIKEINKELKRNIKLIYQNNRYDIKTYKKKDINKLDDEGIIQTLNGQAHFLKIQKRKIVLERWHTREILKEMRVLYKEWLKKY